MRDYFVYIMAGQTQRLYVGVTNNLSRRGGEHKGGTGQSFAAQYKLHRLVFYEEYNDVRNAIQREKQLKGWLRRRKLALIESHNPQWRDLAEEPI